MRCSYQRFHSAGRPFRHRHNHGHFRSDLGGFLPDAGPLLGLRGREREPHLPEHPFSNGLSGHRHPAVYIHGTVVQQHCVILNYFKHLLKINIMKRFFRKLSIIATIIVGAAFFSKCHHVEIKDEVTLSEFSVGIWYADDNPNIQENFLYRIESQEQMDELFASYPSGGLPNINFNEHTLIVVWGAYCHAQSDVQFEKIDESNYIVKVTLTPTIDTSTGCRWSFAGVTSRKLAANEKVTLKIIEKGGTNEN